MGESLRGTRSLGHCRERERERIEDGGRGSMEETQDEGV